MPYNALSQYHDARFPSELSDVRGFEVRTRDDDGRVGRVEDLVCTTDGQIRYLDVDLGGFFRSRHVVVPAGAAQVDRQNDIVWITGLTKDRMKALPDYTGDANLIDDGYETQLRGVYGNASTDRDLSDRGRFYAERDGDQAREARLVLSEEQLSVGKRQVSAGEVGVRKTVETEHVRETVGLMREDVTIERHPVSADAANLRDATIGEDEIRVPLMREEAVVEKRVVPTEEIVLNKRAATEDPNVEADLRRERAVVHDAALRTSAGTTRDARDLRDTRDAPGATGAGVADRAADTVDDMEDRVDGNRASRPGRDATDRPAR